MHGNSKYYFGALTLLLVLTGKYKSKPNVRHFMHVDVK